MLEVNILYIYYFREVGMDHSIRGYLSRRSREELERILEYCKREEGYQYLIEDVLDALDAAYGDSGLLESDGKIMEGNMKNNEYTKVEYKIKE